MNTMIERNVRRELRAAMLLTDPRLRRLAAREATEDELRGLVRPDPKPRDSYTIHPISAWELRIDTPSTWTTEQVVRYAQKFVDARSWDGSWSLKREPKRGGLPAPDGIAYWTYTRKVVLEEETTPSLESVDMSVDELMAAIAILTKRMEELGNKE